MSRIWNGIGEKILFILDKSGAIMIADKVITNIYRHKIDKKIVKIPFEWFELDRKRISKAAEDGTEFGI